MNASKMTVSEVAREFGVTDRTVRRWADEGILPCTRTLGGRGDRRFDVDVVKRALQGDT